MGDQLRRLIDSMGPRDYVEIVILAVCIFAGLCLLGRTRGAGMVRGLGLVVLGLFLAGQIVVSSFDLAELAKLLDTMMTALVVGLLVIFQPELRRGLMVLGRSRGLTGLFRPQRRPVADKLADAALALSRDRVGALVAVQREISLAAYAETGERIDAELSAPLLRALFHHNSPLHDGAVVLSEGRVVAAGCQLPLGHPPAGGPRTGMRHRAALGLSDETDAVLLVVSEETGRISLGLRGVLEPVARENLCRRLAAEVSPGPAAPRLWDWRGRLGRIARAVRRAA